MTDEKQWADATTITPGFMYDLFLGGIIGTKEFRSWLASNDTVFAAVRDADVDNEIDRLARERAQAIRNLEVQEREDVPQQEQQG